MSPGGSTDPLLPASNNENHKHDQGTQRLDANVDDQVSSLGFRVEVRARVRLKMRVKVNKSKA